ncbi:helix-turn-helix domain-containing protein [Geoalkalibacter halelectricus]|uniref:helix-turn-helix domain-containing protein n=1 Tax=Geoalkalibacter halelectricus TaxID=2847045 RepID=UPI003D1DF9D9
MGADLLPTTGLRERLAQVVDLAESAEQLARDTGLSSRVIGKYKSGESLPGLGALAAISAATGVSIDWIATGEGPMLRAQGGEEESDIPLDGEIYMQVTEAVLRVVENYDRPPRADVLIELIRLIHDEVKEGEMRQEEIKKNVVRILKIAS